jgi:hypothetical protein
MSVLHQAREGHQKLSNHSSHQVDTEGLALHTGLNDIVDLSGVSLEFYSLSGVSLNDSRENNFLHVLDTSLLTEGITSVLTGSLGLGILLLLKGTLSLSLCLLVNLVDNSLLMLKGASVKTNLQSFSDAFHLLVLGVDVQPGLGVELGDEVGSNSCFLSRT